MKMHKSKKDKDVYYYYNKNKEKLWSYRHRYYDTLGKRREKSKQGFKTEKQAIRALLEVKANILDGKSKQVEHSNLTVSAWLDLWYETHKNDWKISTRIQRENAIKYQMKPLLGKYKLATLDKTTYKRVYINELLKKYKPSTVQLFHRLFKVAINAAVDDEIIPRNRFNKITIEQEEQKDNFLTASELNKLLQTAKKEENITNYTVLLLLAYTGVRKGEALGLKWQDVDFENKTISINRTRDNKGTREPKTKNSYRTILVDDVVINQLKKYKTWCKKTLFEFGKKINEETYVFISYQTGKAITDNSVLYGLRRAIKKGGIKSITLHGLRHTHATLLISQSIPVKVIADRLGNTPQMILDIYGHSFKELEEESVTVFSSILQQAGGTSGGE